MAGAPVEEILRSSLRDVERISSRGGSRELLRDLEAADRNLAAQLRREATRFGGSTARFTGASAAAYQRQIQLSVGYLRDRLAGQTAAEAMAAAEVGVQRVTGEMVGLERRFTGIVRRPRIAQAARMGEAIGGARRTLLRRMPTSLDRYGAAMVGRFEATMRVGMIQGLSLDEMTAALTGHGGPTGSVSMAATVTSEGVLRLREELIPEGLFRRYRGWAERVVRTETMYAYNGARHDTLATMQREDFPDLKRKIVAVLDKRTAHDSIEVNGQIRGVNEEFEDGAGRRYLYPPGRPNDRETVIPWRDVWKERAEESARGMSDIERATLGEMSPDQTADLLNRVRARTGGEMLPRAPRPAPEPPPEPPPDLAGEAAELAEAERLFAPTFDDPAEVRAWAQGMSDAMSASRRGAKMQATIREGFRERLKRSLGIRSHDLGRAAGRSYRLKNMGNTVWGQHGWDGEMNINPTVHRRAAREMQHIAGASENAILETTDMHHLRTHIHEEIHGCSPGHWTVYRERGILVEEIATETQAREVARRMVGAPRLSSVGGSYNGYIDPVVEELSAVLRPDAIRARDLFTARAKALEVEYTHLDDLAALEYRGGASELSADLQAKIAANDAAVEELTLAQRASSPREMAFRRLREGSTQLWEAGSRAYTEVEAFESAFTEAIAQGNPEIANAVTRGLDRARQHQLETARKGYK